MSRDDRRYDNYGMARGTMLATMRKAFAEAVARKRRSTTQDRTLRTLDDVAYAARLGCLCTEDAAGIIDLLDACGLPTRHPALARREELLGGLEEFREHLGGRLTITLLQAAGRPVDVHEIDAEAMRAAIADRTGPWRPPEAGP